MQCLERMRDVEDDLDVFAAGVDACLVHAQLELADDMSADEGTLQDVDLGDDDVNL